MMEFINSKSIYKLIIKNILKSIIASISRGNPLIIPYVMVTEAGKLQGYLCPTKYLYTRY